MLSPHGERAILDATTNGKAILKFISPNDAGLTKSHQAGFYLPLGAWEMYSPHPPENGSNKESGVAIIWPDGSTTESRVKWYGAKTRHEYRLTCFGKDFPWKNKDSVGNLLVIIPVSLSQFKAYVLDIEDDIEELQTALGLDVLVKWAIYNAESDPEPEDEEACVGRHFRHYVETLSAFPTTKELSDKTWDVLLECIRQFTAQSADVQLLKARDAEYTLFRMVERLLCGPQVQQMFESVDHFLKVAAGVMNRRKARAGRSLENHVERLLSHASVEFDSQPKLVDGRPDIIFPCENAYNDSNYPDSKLLILGVKTTCKDRWRQVTREALRIPQKYILTTQPGISHNQLEEMRGANVHLVVPRRLQRMYPPDDQSQLLTVDEFIRNVRQVQQDHEE